MRIRQFVIQRLDERKWGKKIVERGSVGRWHRGCGAHTDEAVSFGKLSGRDVNKR